MMNPTEIVERIMTQHWDMAACPCWVCVNGRAAGCRAREPYLRGRDRTDLAEVLVAAPAPEYPVKE